MAAGLLEGLPAEIRLEICAQLKLPDLRALIAASPTFYQQYATHRGSILCASLQNTLAGASVDAYAVHISGTAAFRAARNRDIIDGFLKGYQENSAGAARFWTQVMDEKTALEMTIFHQRYVHSSIARYQEWIAGNFQAAFPAAEPYAHETLSEVEECRLTRAMYRFQLCCNLFGRGSVEVELAHRIDFSSVEILQKFFCFFEPWEVEEICCIYSFVHEKYDKDFREIYWDVHRDNPKAREQGDSAPGRVLNFDDSWTRSRLLVGTCAQGLELLSMAHTAANEHSRLARLLQERIAMPAGPFMTDDALGVRAQLLRRHRNPSERDSKQELQEPMVFKDDQESSPPLAWTLIWVGTYSNLYGYYVTNRIRLWGYIFWDSKRLARLGAVDVLMRQWEEDWGRIDPRDSLPHA